MTGHRPSPQAPVPARILLALGLTAFASCGWAEELPGWRLELRPHAGPSVTTVGSYRRSDDLPWAVGGHAGLRLLTGPNRFRAFGLETTWLGTGLDRDEGPRQLLLWGPVAELRFWEVMHIDVGALVASELGDGRRTWFDLQYGVGFEPWAASRWSPLIIYRSDAIFTPSVSTVRSVSGGLRYTF